MKIEEVNKIIAEYMGDIEIAIYYIIEDSWSGGNTLEYTIQKYENYKRRGINCELRQRVCSKEDYHKSLDTPQGEQMHSIACIYTHYSVYYHICQMGVVFHQPADKLPKPSAVLTGLCNWLRRLSHSSYGFQN